jgi:hypothetical protein
MKKPKGKLFTELDEARQAQLADWLLSGVPYHQAQVLVQKEWGLHTTLSALSGFWAEVCGPAMLARRSRAVGLANDLGAEAEARPGQFDRATVDAIKQKAFELAVSPQASPGDVKALFSLVLEAKDQELKAKDIDIKLRRLELLERQSAEAKAKLTEVKAKGGLTQETLKAIEEAAGLL